MEITKQLAVFLDNRPGTLSRVCAALAEAKVNIHALTTSDTIDHSVVRMVVDDPQTAVWLLEERGAMVVEDEVILVEGNNQPGSLSKITRTLADAKVNIEYLYCATATNSKKGLLVMRVDNVKKALKVLNNN